MKNLFFKVFAITFTFISVYSCKSWSAVSDNGDILCSDYHYEEISVLSTKLVNDMKSGYKENQLKEINLGLAQKLPQSLQPGDDLFHDAESMLLPIEQLKEFIYHVETLTKKNRPGITTDQLGIRIYYAAYPDNSKWKGYDKELEGFLNDPVTLQYQFKHTLIIIPTIYNKEKKGMVDFDPREKEGGSIYQNTSGFILKAAASSSQAARNHGSLIPPGR